MTPRTANRSEPGSVTLRDATEADLPIFFSHQIDPEAASMAAFASRSHDAFMTHWAKILQDEAITKKAVLVGEHVAGNIVGFAHGGEPHVGYWIGREYWGRGVATAALRSFLREVRTRPLYARVAKHNLASIRVLEKCGFTLRNLRPGRARAGLDAVEELVYELLS